MIKIIITKAETEYRGHTPLKVGMTGYITKETARSTEHFRKTSSEPLTRVRFACKPLGYEGSEPVFIWVDNDSFKEVK